MPSRDLARILYVEDEKDIRDIARIAIETVGGLGTKICVSGKDAIDAALDYGPDLFLLDVMMPGLDGPTTLAELRKLPGLGAVPAVFMTAKAQRHEVERFLALGAVDVIPKPFNPMTLAEELRAIWRRLPD